MNWDWYLMFNDVRRDREVVVPEVSRIRHDGPGFNVRTWEQAVYHDTRAYSNTSENYTLHNVDQ